MENLNDDCLFQLVQYFSPLDKLNFSRVCQKWSDIMTRIVQKSNVHVTFNMIEDAEIVDCLEVSELEQLVEYFGPDIDHISLLPLSDIPTDTMFFSFDDYYYLVRDYILYDLLSLLEKCCHNVRQLTMSYGKNYETYPTGWLDSFVKSNEQLRTLGIVGSSDGFLDDELKDIPLCLEELSFDSVRYKTDDNLCVFLKNASNLEKLELVRSNMVTSKSLKTMSKHSTKLRVLHLYRCTEPFLSEMSYISKLNQLSELYIGEFRDSLIDENIVEISLGCKNLKKLCLFDNRRITDTGLGIIVSALPKLEELELGFLNISSISSHNFPLSLRVLRLYKCQNLSAMSMCDTLRLTPHLMTLEIINCMDRQQCEKFVCSTISIVLSRSRVFQMYAYEEELGGVKITVYKGSEKSSSDDFLEDSVFYFRCRPGKYELSDEDVKYVEIDEFPDLLSLVDDYVSMNSSTCKMLYEIL